MTSPDPMKTCEAHQMRGGLEVAEDNAPLSGDINLNSGECGEFADDPALC